LDDLLLTYEFCLLNQVDVFELLLI